MMSVARIAAAALAASALGALVAHNPPGWLRGQIDEARAARNPWVAYVAPSSSCKGDSDPLSQEREMVCLLNYARAQRGLARLRVVSLLDRSAMLKALAIKRCQDFSHTACGRPFGATFAAVGYEGAHETAFGENIAWATRTSADPRVIVADWLNSPHHRENLFNSAWVEQGIALLSVSRFLGNRDVEIWVSEFGVRK